MIRETVREWDSAQEHLDFHRHTNYESVFHSQLAINGIPLNLALFFVVIVQARNDG
jgi:hypothetical protein